MAAAQVSPTLSESHLVELCLDSSLILLGWREALLSYISYRTRNNTETAEVAHRNTSSRRLSRWHENPQHPPPPLTACPERISAYSAAAAAYPHLEGPGGAHTRQAHSCEGGERRHIRDDRRRCGGASPAPPAAARQGCQLRVRTTDGGDAIVGHELSRCASPPRCQSAHHSYLGDHLW